MPKAVIKINGKTSSDPLTDVLKFKLDESLQFDASSSEAKSSRIVSYFWDFGDQKKSSESLLKHSYDKTLTQVFPALRVKDSNGFIADSFVEIENSQIENTAPITEKPKSPNQLKIVIPAILSLIMLAVLGRLILSKSGYSKNKNNSQKGHQDGFYR